MLFIKRKYLSIYFKKIFYKKFQKYLKYSFQELSLKSLKS